MAIIEFIKHPMDFKNYFNKNAQKSIESPISRPQVYFNEKTKELALYLFSHS